jgi:hypothetical protein
MSAAVSSPPITAPAFKEWSLVCQGLEEGRSSLILRKGGIAEGRAGFEWKHRQFYLFPTHFHEQLTALHGFSSMPPVSEGSHEISLWAELDFEATVTDWDMVQQLKEFHPWTEEVVRERFAYGTAGSLSVACVRVFRLPAQIVFPDAPCYGGCRSWVQVPANPLPTSLKPVIADATHAARAADLRQRLGITPA